MYTSAENGRTTVPLIIIKWKNRCEKCAEFAQNSRKWCTGFANYACRIFTFWRRIL